MGKTDVKEKTILLSKFNNFFLSRIKNKLIAIFIVLISVPVISVAYISTTSDSAELINKAEESVSNATKQTSNYYEIVLKNIKNGYARQIVLDERIMKWLMYDVSEGALAQFDKTSRANQLIQNIGNSYADTIDRIVVIRKDGNSIGYMAMFNNVAQLAETHLYKRIEASVNGIWIEEFDSNLQNDNRDYVLSYGIPVISSTDSTSIGVILIDIKSDAFLDILRSVHVGKGSLAYAVSKNGKVISVNKKPDEQFLVENNSLLKAAHSYSAGKSEGIFTQNYKGKNYIASYTKSETTGWIFVTAIPESEVISVINSNRNKIFVVGLIFIVLAVFIASLFSLSITKPVKNLMLVMQKVEKGELNTGVTFTRKDELGLLAIGLNSMIEQIKILILKSRQLSEKVNLSTVDIVKISGETTRISQEISKSIQEIAGGMAHQASEAENSISIMSSFANELGGIVNEVKDMKNTSNEVKQITFNGMQMTQELGKKALEADNKAILAYEKIVELNKHLENITLVTKILNGISEQTKLLSLNASIESARAGEAGKGFSVVAEEIRKLADKSNVSTKEIDKMIKKILEETVITSEMVQHTQKAVSEQQVYAKRTTAMFTDIHNSTNQLVKNIEKISGEIEIIDDHKAKVLSSIEATSAVSEETAASTEEVSAATEEQLGAIQQLEEMTQKLNELAQDLNIRLNKFII